MDITTITSDMIENNLVNTSGLCDFLRMAEDYKQEMLMNELRDELNEDEPGHICPYCGNREMLINSHFSHIEMFHPGKSLV